MAAITALQGLRRGGVARGQHVLIIGASDRVLTPRGTLIQSYGDGSRRLGPVGGIASGAELNPVTKQRVTMFVATEDTESLEELRGLIEAGHLTPVIDSQYSLGEAAEAVALVKHGRRAGKVVVVVAE